jgi:hypothetical protein
MDVYALQEERLIAQEPLLMTVKDIAAHFIHDIIAVQPSGPYFLGGSCEGGIIALEIARQFQRQGHEIATLIQFDTPATGFFRMLAWYKRVLPAFRRGRVLPSVIRRIRRSFLPAETHYIWSVIWNAVYNYRSDRTDLEVTLFRATEQGGHEDVAIGWERAGMLTIFDVPGDHDGFVSNPDAHVIIRRVLEGTQRRISSSNLKLESSAR